MIKNPDKKYIGKIDEYKVCLVNGSEIRKSVSLDDYRKGCRLPDFLDFGVYSSENNYSGFREIPKDEIWIAEEIDKNEKRAAIKCAIVYLRLQKKQYNENVAYVKAKMFEKKIREKYNTFTETDILIKNIGTINGITVTLVNGFAVRNLKDDDFSQGGHDLVYNYIPENTIWIDNTIASDEYGAVMVHEYVERHLMKNKKYEYEKAHGLATRAEYKYRENKK